MCVQEPNIKEGVGGLRDLHAVLWVAQARHGSRGLADARAAGLLSEREHQAALRAYDFLLRVRAEAHFVTGRKTDVLTLDLQPAVAKSLGYEDSRGLLASELFMRDYYRRASDLHGVFRSVLRRPTEEAPRRLFAALTKRRPARDFEVRDGRLRAKSEALLASGHGLLSAFAAAQAEGVPLSDELALAVRERLSLVDRELRESRETAAVFVDILRWRGRVGLALRAMHETGFLGRFLPEFGRVSFLVQHDFFHRYTVDEHTLRAIEAIDEVASGTEAAVRPFGRILDEVEDAAPLYLGMLLHDVGKGHGGGHSERGARMAPRVLRPARARRAGHRGRRLPRRRASRDVPDLAAPRPDRGQPRRLLRRARRQRPPAEPAPRPDLRRPPRGGPGHLERVEGDAPLGALQPDPPAPRRPPRRRRSRRDGPGAGDRRACAASSRRRTSSATSRSSRSATSAPPTRRTWPATSAWSRAGARRRRRSSGATSPTATARS